METIEIKGKRYLKASSAARETGYTMDYIGQLCRKRKIDAELVGRTWYVCEDQIREHRRTRGKVNPAKVREAVQKEIQLRQRITTQTVRPPSRRHSAYEPEIRYHTDAADIIPRVTSRHLAVSSHDREEPVATSTETPIVLHTENNESHLEPQRDAHHEDIHWNGTIVVAPLEEEAISETDHQSAVAERHIVLHTKVRSVDIPIRSHGHANELVSSTPEKETTAEGAMPKYQNAYAAEHTHVSLSLHPVNDNISRARYGAAPGFIEKLNHAHVLNEKEDFNVADHVQSDDRRTSLHDSKKTGYAGHSIITTVAVFVCCGVFAFAGANMFLGSSVVAVQQSEKDLKRLEHTYILTHKSFMLSQISPIRDIANIIGK